MTMDEATQEIKDKWSKIQEDLENEVEKNNPHLSSMDDFLEVYNPLWAEAVNKFALEHGLDSPVGT